MNALPKRLALLLRNPVVVRDLRVQMRGTRSLWAQTVYLLLLGLVAAIGYAAATDGGSGSLDPVRAQARLQDFYQFIFYTLAALTSLIAPALTATAITTERMRQTMDLLVTTPLRSGELLIGKLISSTAFLALLLVLSLPASALCVLLGGATLADVFRVYGLLLVDGLVLAAIGLYFSSTAANNMQAMGRTYAAVFSLCWWSAGLGLGGFASGLRGSAEMSPVLAIALLNPFLAVSFGSGYANLWGANIPLWLGTGILAVLLIRLILTATSYHMGNYGGNPVGSLRRQLLFLCGAAVSLVSYSVFLAGGVSLTRAAPQALSTLLMVAFFGSALFHPSLFAFDREKDGATWYRLRDAFQPRHAGSLPYLHVWLLVLAACALAPIVLLGYFKIALLVTLAATLFYLSGVAFLFCMLARIASRMSATLASARTMTSLFQAMVVAIPLLLAVLLYQRVDSDDPLLYVWICRPFTQLERNGSLLESLLIAGAFSYGLGALVAVLTQRKAVSHAANPG